MPLATIHLRKGAPPEYRRAIADSVHRAMMEALGIPADDRFQLIVEHPPENMIHDWVFFGVVRSDDSVFVQIVINHRAPSEKLKMNELIAANLAESPGIRKEDVFIGVVEVARENWWAYARSGTDSGPDTPAAAARLT
jgi:4-oxalocrotonate tautomerase